MICYNSEQFKVVLSSCLIRKTALRIPPWCCAEEHLEALRALPRHPSVLPQLPAVTSLPCFLRQSLTGLELTKNTWLAGQLYLQEATTLPSVLGLHTPPCLFSFFFCELWRCDSDHPVCSEALSWVRYLHQLASRFCYYEQNYYKHVDAGFLGIKVFIM